MSRHRDVRNLDYDEEYDEAYDDAVYGRSVDDNDYGTSPSAEQYLYSRSRGESHGFGAYFQNSNEIKEEDENKEEESRGLKRMDSSNYVRPHLCSEDQAKLNSIFDEIRNVVGDQFSEAEMTHVVLESKYNFEASLNILLDQNTKVSDTSNASALPISSRKKTTQSPRPQKSRSPPRLKDNAEKSPRSSRHVVSEPVVVTTPNRASKSVVMGFKPKENGVLPHKDEIDDLDEGLPIRMDEVKENVVQKPMPKIRDKQVAVASKYQVERGSDKPVVNLVVVGHVDAGKSTLMGHLLYLQGDVPQRTMHKYEQESKKLGKQAFMYAWVLDDTEEERSKGVTVDIAQRSFTTTTKIITLLDAPGHKDFIPNMITGAARADVAVLVVDASRGGFETGFESGGQTREHAILIRSLGISQLAVAINKLDMADWSKERFDEIQASLKTFLKIVGFKSNDVLYVPCSGLTGENLIAKSTQERLNQWYDGITILQAIDKLKIPERGVERPVRLCISDVFKGQGSSTGLSGRLETGYVQNGDRLLLLPQGEIVNIKGVQVESSSTGFAFAGDHTIFQASIQPSVVPHVGDFLTDPLEPMPLAMKIIARIVVFNVEVPIIKGSQFDFHYQSVSEMAKIRKLVSLLHKSTGQIIKQRPRALTRNSSAIIHIEFTRPLCIEVFKDYKELGRFMLRSNGTTIAAGMVTQIL